MEIPAKLDCETLSVFCRVRSGSLDVLLDSGGIGKIRADQGLLPAPVRRADRVHGREPGGREMSDIEFVDPNKPIRVGEFWFKNPNKKCGIWRIPNQEGLWSIGVEFIDSLEDYADSSITLQNFLRSKKDILQGLTLNIMIKYSGQNREMIFLEEDAMFDVFLLQYSTKPNAIEYQNGAREKFNELRKTGIALRGDVEDKLQDPHERTLILKMLLNMNEEYIELQSKVQDIDEKQVVLIQQLNKKYLSPDNRDLLNAIVHQIHLNTGIPHGVIFKDIYKQFRIYKPKSNMRPINFILDKDFPFIKQYLEKKYKLLPFFMNTSKDKTEADV